MRGILKTSADLNAWLALGAAVLLGLALIGHRIFVSPEGRVIVHDENAPWIMAAEPFSANIRQWGRSQAPITRFRGPFRLQEAEGGVLRIRAYGAMEVRLNGKPVPVDGSEDRDWKSFQQIDVGRWMRPGRNQIDVDVRNRRGPALLSLRLVSGSHYVQSDSRFQASVAGRPLEPAQIASDVRSHPDAGSLPSPGQALRQRAWALVLLLAFAVGLSLVIVRTRSTQTSTQPSTQTSTQTSTRLETSKRGPQLAAALLGLAWGLLFLLKFLDIPLGQGFDGARHLEYLAFLAQEQRIPLPHEGWSMYHPPLYYLIVNGLRDAGAMLGDGFVRFVTRLPSFAAGVAVVWLSGRLAGRLQPDRPALRYVAMAFAAVLPMNLMLAAYVSNEGLLAALSAAILVSACGLLTDEAPERDSGELAVLSALIGLALLTKMTAVVLTAVVMVFVGTRLKRRTETEPWLRARALVALIAPAALIAGWFYLRNAFVYRSLWVGNWALPGDDQIWWSPPGFHTLDYYTAFGHVLVEPWYAAFGSFWDALYSTTWGDGMLAGSASVDARTAAWDYDWMALGYWAAVPISAIVLYGIGRWLRDCVREEPAERRAALGLPLVFLLALGFSIGFGTIELPYYGQGKAFYALSLSPVLALGFALGWESLDGQLMARLGPPGRVALLGLVGTCFGIFFLGFAG